MTCQRENLQGKKGPSFLCQVFVLVVLKKGLIASQEGVWEQMYKMRVWARACKMCVWDVSVQGLCERVQGKYARCICVQDTSECECTTGGVGGGRWGCCAAVGQVTSSRAQTQGWDWGHGEAKLTLGAGKVPSWGSVAAHALSSTFHSSSQLFFILCCAAGLLGVTFLKMHNDELSKLMN